MQNETSSPALKKMLIGISLAIVVLVIFLSIGGKEKANTNEDTVYRNTISITRAYVALRLKTDKILIEAAKYPDYNTWSNEMTALIKNWENLELKANELERHANFLAEDKLSFKLINEVHAYSKDEISNVFDKAPAGRKIRTLAKFLGVDAKRAFKILQNDQEFVKADAWNKAGDTFKKLEVSAIVIKDGCKVAGFVGGMIITGGAAGLTGGATIGQATVLIVTGTDLMLEVSEDAATIGLGDKHKVTKMISGARSYTDPAASILSLTDIPSNVAKGAALLDKVGVVLTQVDQIRSMLQDGKLLGINITSDSKIEIASIAENEVEKWVDENKVVDIPTGTSLEAGEGSESEETKSETQERKDEDGYEYEEEGYLDDLEEWMEGFEDLDDWLDDFDEEEFADEEEEIEIQAEEDVDMSEGSETEETKAEDNKEGDDDDDDAKVMEDSTVEDYAAKMMEMRTKDLITEAEWQEVLKEIKEMIKQRDEEDSTVEENIDPEDQETELLEENLKRREQIGRERGDILKMTTKEFIEDTEIYSAKNDARKVWLKAECERIFSDEERVTSCYYTGK